MMGEGRVEFYARGSRFVLCSRREAERLGGRVLTQNEAAGLIGDQLRSADSGSLRSLYAELCVAVSPASLNRVSNAEVMRWFLRELDDTWLSRLVVIELSSMLSRRAKDSRSESIRIVVESIATQLRHEDLHHGGRRYRVASASTRELGHEPYEVLPAREAEALLATMATGNRSRPVKV